MSLLAGISPRSSNSRPLPHPSHHPCFVDRPLTAQLTRLQALGVAPTTRRTYQAGVAQFLRFCSRYHLPPIPASPLTHRYFAAYLSLSVKHSTIKIYLAALRQLHIESGYTDPTADTLLQYTIKGIKRSQTATPRSRLPITISILRQLKQALHDSSSVSAQDKRMLCAAFYGFLRASEFCSPSIRSFAPDRTLCLEDVTLSASSAQLHIKASKNRPLPHRLYSHSRSNTLLHLPRLSTAEISRPAFHLVSQHPPLRLSGWHLPHTPSSHSPPPLPPPVHSRQHTSMFH